MVTSQPIINWIFWVKYRASQLAVTKHSAQGELDRSTAFLFFQLLAPSDIWIMDCRWVCSYSNCWSQNFDVISHCHVGPQACKVGKCRGWFSSWNQLRRMENWSCETRSVIPYHPQIPPFNSLHVPTEHGSPCLLDPVLLGSLWYFASEHNFN